MFKFRFSMSLIFVSSIILRPAIAQDADTSEYEESGNEMFTSVDVSFSQDKGNTDFLSLYYGFSYSIVGQIGPLEDTEFSINFSRSDDSLDG